MCTVFQIFDLGNYVLYIEIDEFFLKNWEFKLKVMCLRIWNTENDVIISVSRKIKGQPLFLLMCSTFNNYRMQQSNSSTNHIECSIANRVKLHEYPCACNRCKGAVVRKVSTVAKHHVRNGRKVSYTGESVRFFVRGCEK